MVLAVTLGVFTVNVILGFIIPVLTAVVTKASASPVLKGAVTLTLSAIAGLINTAITITGEAVFSQAMVQQATLTWLIALASYLGLWKQLEINNKLAPEFGLGK